MTTAMTPDQQLTEHRIREHAFQLWQEAGCPDGRADEFWHRARAAAQTEDQTPAEDIVEAAGGHYPPTGDTQNFA